MPAAANGLGCVGTAGGRKAGAAPAANGLAWAAVRVRGRGRGS